MTILFKQTSKAAAKSKMRRLVGNTTYGTIGFCNVTCRQAIPHDTDPRFVDKDDYWVIELQSNYHAETTMNRMYETNGKQW
jgi:hypothetical protein